MLCALTDLGTVYLRFFNDCFFNILEKMNTFENVVNLNWFKVQLHFIVKDGLKAHIKVRKFSTFDYVFD
jgi:hypothetical protein